MLLIDGTRVGGQVCLVAASVSYALDWLWAPWESSITWTPLLSRTPEPHVVVCDGQKGIELAVKRAWPDTRAQRCLFHVWMNIRKKLTLNPQSQAGRDLLDHYRTIWSVDAEKKANEWCATFKQLHTAHESFIKERTQHPSPKPEQRKWWYTHRSVPSTYRQIDKLIMEHKLFAYTEPSLISKAGQHIPRTTNFVEGGINSQLKELIRLHRGMPPNHQHRLADWYLYDKTEHGKPPRNCL